MNEETEEKITEEELCEAIDCIDGACPCVVHDDGLELRQARKVLKVYRALKSQHSDCVSKEEYDRLGEIALGTERRANASADQQTKLREALIDEKQNSHSLKTALSEQSESHAAEVQGVREELADASKAASDYMNAKFHEKVRADKAESENTELRKELALLNKTMRELIPDHKLALKDIVERAVGAEQALKTSKERNADLVKALEWYVKKKVVRAVHGALGHGSIVGASEVAKEALAANRPEEKKQ